MSTQEIDQILETTPIPGEMEESTLAPTTLRTIAKKIGKEYLDLVDECIAFYQNHDELSLSLPRDRRVYLEKVERHGSLYMVHFLTENFLPCLEAIKDHNRDYFAYQSDSKASKSKGRVEKERVKMTYFIGKTTMKRVVQDAGRELLFKIFDFFTRSFKSLTVLPAEGESITFREDYVKYVSDHFDDHANFAKMGLVIDHVDAILEEYDSETVRQGACEEDGACGEGEGEGGKKKKKKKGKKGSGGADFDPFSMFGAGMGDQMGKGLLNSFESTKIGQLAKNISGKMRPDDFPMLSDPSKLLASLTGSQEEGAGGGIGDLIKFVMEEVQTTLKEENINEADLINEAQGMMGGISKMTGMDPESMMRSMASATAPPANAGEAVPPPAMPDFSQFAGIFENLGKELQKGLQDAENVKGKSKSKKSRE